MLYIVVLCYFPVYLKYFSPTWRYFTYIVTLKDISQLYKFILDYFTAYPSVQFEM
jgi:hypothetical protein